MNYVNDHDIIQLLYQLHKNQQIQQNTQLSKEKLKTLKLKQQHNHSDQNEWSLQETIYLFEQLQKHEHKFKNVHVIYSYRQRTINELKHRYYHVRDQVSSKINSTFEEQQLLKEEDNTKIEQYEIKIKQEDPIPYQPKFEKVEIPFSNPYDISDETLRNIHYIFLTNQQELKNIQNNVAFLRSDWINKSFPLPNKEIQKLVESNLATYSQNQLMYSQGCQEILFQFKYAILNCLKEITLTKKKELLKEELCEKQRRLIQVLQNKIWCKQYFQN